MTLGAVGDPAEAKNFKLLGHDPSAAWGGGSLVEIKNGFAYVGAVGGSSYNGPEGFTVHDVSNPSKPKKVAEVNPPPGIHNHKVRIVEDDLLYVNYECLETPEGQVARAGIKIYDITHPASPKEVGFYDMPGRGPHRFGVDNDRNLAFIPNDADGWRNRVSWTVDIANPIKPALLSLWGLPEQDLSLEMPYEEAKTMEQTTQCHGPAVIRDDRMYCGFWGGRHGDCRLLGPSGCQAHLRLVLVSPFHRIHPHCLAHRQ